MSIMWNDKKRSKNQLFVGGGATCIHIFAHNLLHSPSNLLSVGTGKPSEKESDVKCGAVQIHKLEEEHLQRKAVLPLRFCPWVLWRGGEEVERWMREKINVSQSSGKQKIMRVWIHMNNAHPNLSADRPPFHTPGKKKILISIKWKRPRKAMRHRSKQESQGG